MPTHYRVGKLSCITVLCRFSGTRTVMGLKPCSLVTIVLRLVGSLDGYANIVCLFFTHLCQDCPKFVEMEYGVFLIKLFTESIHPDIP